MLANSYYWLSARYLLVNLFTFPAYCLLINIIGAKELSIFLGIQFILQYSKEILYRAQSPEIAKKSETISKSQLTQYLGSQYSILLILVILTLAYGVFIVISLRDLSLFLIIIGVFLNQFSYSVQSIMVISLESHFRYKEVSLLEIISTIMFAWISFIILSLDLPIVYITLPIIVDAIFPIIFLRTLKVLDKLFPTLKSRPRYIQVEVREIVIISVLSAVLALSPQLILYIYRDYQGAGIVLLAVSVSKQISTLVQVPMRIGLFRFSSMNNSRLAEEIKRSIRFLSVISILVAYATSSILIGLPFADKSNWQSLSFVFPIIISAYIVHATFWPVFFPVLLSKGWHFLLIRAIILSIFSTWLSFYLMSSIFSFRSVLALSSSIVVASIVLHLVVFVYVRKINLFNLEVKVVLPSFTCAILLWCLGTVHYLQR